VEVLNRQQDARPGDDKDQKSTTTNETSVAQSTRQTVIALDSQDTRTNCPEKDTHPRSRWAIRCAEQYMGQKRARKIMMMTKAWNQMLLVQAIAPVEHGVG